MTIKILVFRTDRIGDLLYSCPTIITIKKNIKNSHITLITSTKNFLYAKSLNIFDEVYCIPKNSLIKKLKFIFNLSRSYFHYVFIFDGKNRSIVSSLLIRAQYKIAIISEKKLNFFWKFFKIKFFNDINKNLYVLHKESLEFCKLYSKINNYNFLTFKKDNNFSSMIPIKNYLHIHLDEKWFSDLYIKTYTNILPNYISFVDFLTKISKKNNILITTGIIHFYLIDELINKYFKEINPKIYLRKDFDRSIYLINKPTFDDVESLLRNSNTLISCHGAITHAANSFDIKNIDIIEEKREKFYRRFTSYLKNYTFVYRRNFNTLKNNLLKII